MAWEIQCTAVVATPIWTRQSLWFEIGALWATITYVKVMPQPWTSGSKQIWIRSFLWDTVLSCMSRDCKYTKGQSWRLLKNLPVQPLVRVGPSRQYLFWPPTLTSRIFEASWPTRIYNTSFKRSDSYLIGARSPRVRYDF